MPSIVGRESCQEPITPQKRRLRSETASLDISIASPSPPKRKSPRSSINGSINTPSITIDRDSGVKPLKSCTSTVKILSESFVAKSNLNPIDNEQMRAVKEALHVSTAPSEIVCREEEQIRVLEFCKDCIKHERSGSLYVCGCPGTGKSLSIEKVKHSLINWAEKTGFQSPDILSLNCTSLAHNNDIFAKILGRCEPQKKITGSASALQSLQNLYSHKQQSTQVKMMLVIADELDYLITKDKAVLHDLFMLTTLPFSRCILIGIANAIDLADRFLPRLQSLNCKPVVVSFRAYSKDQIIAILQQRLESLPYTVFHPKALELCARKVAAATGDMRKALCVCRSAIEMLELEVRELAGNLGMPFPERPLECVDQQAAALCDSTRKQDMNIVRVDHMAVALAKTFRSPVVDIIQSLPQHQQIILCSAVKLFRRGKKDTTIAELNKSYVEFCKMALVPPVGILEISNMCRVLSDQGLLKLGQSKDEKSRRVTLKADEADISFALQGIRFFRNSLQ